MSCEAPGVRIPPSPLDHKAERTTERSSVLFLCLYVREQALALQPQNPKLLAAVFCIAEREEFELVWGLSRYEHGLLLGHSPCAFSNVSALWLRHSNPCGEQKGKALNGATIRSVVANPSLSALNSLQGVDFQPCRLFCTQKVAPKMHRPRFYALLRAFFKLHISHTSYPTFSLCLQYNTTIFISTRHSVRHYGGCYFVRRKI